MTLKHPSWIYPYRSLRLVISMDLSMDIHIHGNPGNGATDVINCAKFLELEDHKNGISH